ncbi:MAG TPA: hypothetical protein VGJ84_08470, partial [Polyangiaceae bacterium]
GTLLLPAGGPVLGAAIGAGGMLPGNPLRVYLIGLIAGSRVSEGGGEGTLTWRTQREFFDAAAGLRVYLPIYGPVRLLGEAALGESHARAQRSSSDGSVSARDAWLGILAFAGGVQVRVVPWFSVGANARFIFHRDLDFEAQNSSGGSAALRRTVLSATATGHF